MKVQLFKYWKSVRSSFWFVPTSMAVTAVVMALAGVYVDTAVTEWLSEHWGWSFKSGAEGASAVLGVIAGSMITIAGVVFSMTLVALSLASSQLGPRLLRTFMRDTRTQIVLGTFIATFVYCLLVLGTIRRAEDIEFVPHLSVSLGVVFAVASVSVLIYFIHHVSVSIQANEIAARIGSDLIRKIDDLFPDHLGQAPGERAPDAEFLEAFEQQAQAVVSDRDGYLQLIDGEALLALAVEQEWVVRLERKPGNYVVAFTPLVQIWPAGRVTDALARKVQSCFVLGPQRTFDQDIEFAVNQLVEMAVRALSPGVNDPFTAIACVDHLGSALCRLGARAMPSRYRHDDQDQLRLLAQADTFPQLVDAAFHQIRQCSRTHAALSLRLLETLTVILGFAGRPEDRAALLRHADMIARGAREALPEEQDRRAVEACWQTLHRRAEAESMR